MIIQLESSPGSRPGTIRWSIGVTPTSREDLDRGEPDQAELGMYLLDAARDLLKSAGVGQGPPEQKSGIVIPGPGAKLPPPPGSPG